MISPFTTEVLNEWIAMGAGASSMTTILSKVHKHKKREKNTPMSPLEMLKHAIQINGICDPVNIAESYLHAMD